MTELDRNDRKILAQLQKDSSISNVNLAEIIGMAPSPCLRRVRSLEERGFIDRYVALLDRRKLGFGLAAYVAVKVPQIIGDSVVDRFNAAIKGEPAIVACYVTAGQFDYLLKVVARDMDAYSDLVQRVLLKLPGVTDARSTFVMDVIKDSTEFPL
jgi:Lrp/AsnC family leucine-responsive transcriptional regulator